MAVNPFGSQERVNDRSRMTPDILSVSRIKDISASSTPAHLRPSRVGFPVADLTETAKTVEIDSLTPRSSQAVRPTVSSTEVRSIKPRNQIKPIAQRNQDQQ
jgi:hypothetical protein